MAKKKGMGAWSKTYGLIAIAFAIVSSVMGFLPVVRFCACLLDSIGFACALTAIVLGIIALVIGRKRGKGAATVGIFLGILYFLIWLFMFVYSL